MPTSVEIHPTAKIAAYALSIALVVVFAIIGAKRLLNPDSSDAQPTAKSSLSTGHGSDGGTITEKNAQVYFSPRGGCTAAVVAELEKAKTFIRVQAYSFTSTPIARALVDAKKRGVDVVVVLDRTQQTEPHTEADYIAHAGIPTLIDTAHTIAHNKVIVIDGATVITGSFNLTKAAEEHNAENMLVIHDTTLALKYVANWEAHRAHSAAYAGQ